VTGDEIQDRVVNFNLYRKAFRAITQANSKLCCDPYEPTPHKSVDYRAFRLQITTEGIIEIFAQ
jgi:hypothetical protein